MSRCLLRLGIFEVIVENHIVVVLLHMFGQIEVFRQETDQFVGWSVVGDLMRLSSLVLQHDIEELAPVSTTLNFAVDVEVEDRKRFHLDNRPGSIADEKFLKADFEETDAFVSLGPYEENVTVCTDFSSCSDLAREPLGLKKHPNVNFNCPQGEISLTFALACPIESITCTSYWCALPPLAFIWSPWRMAHVPYVVLAKEFMSYSTSNLNSIFQL